MGRHPLCGDSGNHRASDSDEAGLGVAFEITTKIEYKIQWGGCDDFDLTVERTPYPGESGCDL